MLKQTWILILLCWTLVSLDIHASAKRRTSRHVSASSASNKTSCQLQHVALFEKHDALRIKARKLAVELVTAAVALTIFFIVGPFVLRYQKDSVMLAGYSLFIYFGIRILVRLYACYDVQAQMNKRRILGQLGCKRIKSSDRSIQCRGI